VFRRFRGRLAAQGGRLVTNVPARTAPLACAIVVKDTPALSGILAVRTGDERLDDILVRGRQARAPGAAAECERPGQDKPRRSALDALRCASPTPAEARDSAGGRLPGIDRVLSVEISEVTLDTCHAVDGETVTIRPLQIADVDMEADFIRRLSRESRQFRLLAAVKELPLSEVRRLCTVDGTYSMAFVATVRRDGREEEIGVSRYAPTGNADVPEIAITVADEWQRKGLGALLVEQLVQYAKTKGVKQLHAIALASNTAMQALAKHLGMSTAPDPDDHCQTIYSLAL